MSTIVGEDAPKPRLCHMKKWPDFNGYGFNLHAERGKAGQFIGKVDDNSPASAAGLKEGDRIVEVNGTNIGNENHQQVVQRIKAVPNETKLLVVDNEADKYYKDKKIVVRGDMPSVRIFECPDTRPTAQPNGTASQLTTVEVNHTPQTTEPQVTAQVNHEEEAAPPPPLTSAPPPEVNGEPEKAEVAEVAAAVTTVTVSETTVVETKQESQLEREPSPEPVLLAAPEPVVQAAPEPVVEVTPEPVMQAAPEPVVEVTPEPVMQAEPEPVVQTTTVVTEVRTEEVKEEVRSEPEPVVESTPPPVAAMPPQVEEPPQAEPAPEPERPLTRGKDDEPFRMSAKEYREKMMSKKRDVKNTNLSMAEKFQLFQRM